MTDATARERTMWPVDRPIRVLALSDLRRCGFAAIETLCASVGPDLLLYAGDDVARFGDVPDDERIRLARALARASARSGLGSVTVTTSLGLTAHGTVVRLVGRQIVQTGAWTLVSLFDDGRTQVAGSAMPIGRFTDLASGIPLGIAGVIGNDCSVADAAVFSAPGCWDLHASPLVVGAWTIIGLAGAPDQFPPGLTLYPEATAAARLDEALSTVQTRNCLLVSHAPPQGVLDHAVRFGSRSIGSEAVRARLSALRAVLCGHVHLFGGRSEMVEGCLVVNAANHDDDDAALAVRYAVLELGPDGVTVSFGEYRDRAAVESLQGISLARGAALRKQGIETIEDVLAAPDHVLDAALRNKRETHRVRVRARAVVEGALRVIEWQHAPSEFVIVAVETSLDPQDVPWLIGLSFPDGRVVHLDALDPGDHASHLQRLNVLLEQWAWDHKLVQWSPFGRSALQGAYRTSCLDEPEWLAAECWFDACRWAQQTIALPKGDFGLETVEQYFGFSRRHEGVDGLQAGHWYAQYRQNGTTFDVGRVRNADNVAGCRHVIASIRALLEAHTADQRARTAAEQLSFIWGTPERR